MKRYMLIILVLLLMAFFVAGSDAQKNAKELGQLTVVIVGLKSDEGKVKIALFDSKDNYTGDGDPFRGASVVIKDRKAECTFEGISYGTYPIKL